MKSHLNGERETSRLETFSDAIFAFAATLLVVTLEVPRTVDQLMASLTGFLAFGFSFTALVGIWVAHHGYFRRFGRLDGITILLNGVLLFVVLFYVYPLKFLSSAFVQFFSGGRLSREVQVGSIEELGALFTVYGIGWSTVFLCMALLFRHSSRRDQSLTAVERYDAVSMKGHYLILVLVGLVSIVLALAGASVYFGAPGWIYASLGPLCYFHGSYREKRRPPVVEP